MHKRYITASTMPTSIVSPPRLSANPPSARQSLNGSTQMRSFSFNSTSALYPLTSTLKISACLSQEALLDCAYGIEPAHRGRWGWTSYPSLKSSQAPVSSLGAATVSRNLNITEKITRTHSCSVNCSKYNMNSTIKSTYSKNGLWFIDN